MNLLQMSFTGAVMILAVTVIRALAINKVPKKTFLVLWGITLVRLMIPFSLPSWFSIYSLWNREMPTEGMNTAAGMLIPVIPAEHQATIPHNTVGPVANVSAPEIIWILGCVLCAFFFAAAYSKTVDGEQDIMVGYNPEDIMTGSSYDYFVKLENGEEKLFGPYETPDELLAAVESFCNDQVKLGNMDQSEAREIVSQCVQN